MRLLCIVSENGSDRPAITAQLLAKSVPRLDRNFPPIPGAINCESSRMQRDTTQLKAEVEGNCCRTTGATTTKNSSRLARSGENQQIEPMIVRAKGQ